MLKTAPGTDFEEQKNFLCRNISTYVEKKCTENKHYFNIRFLCSVFLKTLFLLRKMDVCGQ